MKILVVDDDELTRISVKTRLEDPKLRGASGIPNQVTAVGSMAEAHACFDSEIYDAAFLDIRLGPHHHNGGIDLLKQVKQKSPTTVVIMMTSVEDFETIEKCLKIGADDYVFKPFDFQQVHLLMIKARAIHRSFRKEQNLRAQAGDQAVAPIYLTSKSPLFQKILEQAKRLKSKDITVLLLGETGVGKDVMARYLWTLEEDESRPFAAVHSGGLAEGVVESEIFGHVKGAFTGATERRTGKFQYAHGGDFFLDEIGSMPMSLQLKMLRVLQDKRVTPVGSNSSIAVNCRIICATNENLEALIAKGSFREDLHFRISRAVLKIPPLRDRKEDIPDLINLFLNKHSLGRLRLSQSAFRLCLDYNWPGNVRQLDAALETLSLMIDGPEITSEDLYTQISQSQEPMRVPYSNSIPEDFDQEFGLNSRKIHRNYKHLIKQFEQRMVQIAIKEAKSENAAAQYLGIPRSTLVSKLRSWGLPDSESGTPTAH